MLEDFQELERENSSLRTNYNELKHEHETLLLLHGESIVRNEELEEENKNIKDVCKEQVKYLIGKSNSISTFLGSNGRIVEKIRQ